MKLMRNTTMLAIAALTLAASLGALVYMSWYISRQGAILERDLQQYVNQEAQEQEYLALERELAATRDERARLASLALDGDEGTVTFLSEVDRIAAELGVTLVTEKLEVHARKDAQYDELAATFRLEGSESAVRAMLTILETWPYHSYVRAVELDRRIDPAAGTGALAASVTLAVTLRKE